MDHLSNVGIQSSNEVKPVMVMNEKYDLCWLLLKYIWPLNYTEHNKSKNTFTLTKFFVQYEVFPAFT